MKAISLSRPWPYAILNLGKRIENRTRKDGRVPNICRHRGPLLLHAAKSWDKGGAEFIRERGLDTRHGRLGPGEAGVVGQRTQHVAGAIVGRCVAVAHIDLAETVWVAPTGAQTAAQEEEATRIAAGLDLRWWMGGYALVLVDVVPTPVVPCRGMLGCWNVPQDILEQLEQAERRRTK